MSANFRAVRVEWGESTAQFLVPLHLNRVVSWQNIFGDVHDRQYPWAFGCIWHEIQLFEYRCLFGSGSAGLGQANVMCVLESIAEKAETAAEAGTAGNELEEFWVEDGSRFLDTLQSSTQEEFQYWLDLGPEAGSDLEALFDNMQALAETWRQQIDSNGNLRLWLDRRVDGPT